MVGINYPTRRSSAKICASGNGGVSTCYPNRESGLTLNAGEAQMAASLGLRPTWVDSLNQLLTFTREDGRDRQGIVLETRHVSCVLAADGCASLLSIVPIKSLPGPAASSRISIDR